jgi:hypothetical protein
LVFFQDLFSQEYFSSPAVNINLPNNFDYYFEKPYFDFERISSSYDLLDIAINRVETPNRIRQFNLNYGNGTFSDVNQYSTQGYGNFIGNVFVKLRSSTGLKDLVAGRNNRWEILRQNIRHTGKP